jgi:hypothetical protein
MEKQEKTGYIPLVPLHAVFHSGVKLLRHDFSKVRHAPFPGQSENPQHHNSLEISQVDRSRI